MRYEKKLIKTLSEQQRNFVRLVHNYCLSLVLSNKEREIKELSDLIKLQNERSDYK